MDDFQKLLILSYFKNKKKDYSLQDLATRLGMNLLQLDMILGEMIDMKLIKRENYLLRLDFPGRIALQNSVLEYYVFNDEPNHYDSDTNKSFYTPINFSKSKWRR